ncbi:anaphase-promoting complex subunit 5 [Neodiprion pinetum]|uniref:Anaphase-promoting complex subunit 5 n=1 Tax=Neodiprion lecontei TaxID=441921 RepID=A0A6J0BSF0_NEOLC|nr:anaphase-promoting complex subunit 5 [Neodiprion lecontei]XP_046410696.1 anaphase-promoting complex subunit 5 [Neodiprion fabricii]XP_046410697.1 anaphase-promoting complex subunit 5 [Neodiprion fabricii]XP_046410698.1 anaphase-promoting complex subunit 5 [Neodiprion fabricii]XP_046466280.1 anaphase-promoting complex subunit 5 [Neodiprion pinetum]XP_046466281.1 anaphase-promoting complex subunit 5 [Neodiprion pinetum]XP_046466282.1 anaphase-promoting complex subunit 5 [Neodiprion pinetum]
MNKDLLNIGTNVKKCQKETLTPYKIAVVMLIREYCNEPTKAIIERRDFCVLALKLIQSPDLDFRNLLNLLHSEEYVLQRFAQQLEVKLDELYHKGVEGLLDLSESLMRLMDTPLDHCVAHPALNKNSVLGLYTRRIIISFEKLTFHQVVALYESFKPYWQVLYKMENLGLSMGHKMDELLDNQNDVVWGGRQAELLVAQQALALQTDEHKALPPAELQALVKELLNCSPYYAEAHYLSYLNCLRVNEYCGAVDSLYHCFDRLAPLDNRATSEDRTRTFRYAALNLAALHAQFGHKKVALAALKEAIMMAQESGDNICLQHAHSWMYHLIDDRKGQLIERSVDKASMLVITHTISLRLIASAHYSAIEAKSPPQVFETLVKSDVLNCQHSMIDLMSMSYAEKAALWAYYGKTKMSSLCSQLLLLHNSGDKKQQMFNGSSTCQAVVNVANIFVELGEYILAEVVLDHAKERFPNEPSSKIWMISEQMHKFTRTMRHEKWSEAEAIAKQISSIDPLESKFRQAEVSFAKGDFPRIMELIDSIEKTKNLNPQNQVRLMILSSQVMCSSRFPGLGTTGTNALALLNTAVEIATSKHLSYQQAIIKMNLANIQLVMGMPSQAMKLVNDAIIPVLSHGGCLDQGRAFVLYAKCLLATTVSSITDDRKSALENAVKSLRKAKDHFNKIEAFSRVKNVLYLLSILYHELDSKAERNQCAFEYRQLDMQFPTKSDSNITMY